MAKRDTTFQAVEESKEKAKMQLLETENILRVMKAEKGEAEQRLKEKETGTDDLC